MTHEGGLSSQKDEWRPKSQVVIASTCPRRLGVPLGSWEADAAVRHGGFEVEVVDLARFGLPLLDEPNLPRDAQYTKDHTRRWSAAGPLHFTVFVLGAMRQ